MNFKTFKIMYGNENAQVGKETKNWQFFMGELLLTYGNGAPQTGVLKYDWISLWKIVP